MLSVFFMKISRCFQVGSIPTIFNRNKIFGGFKMKNFKRKANNDLVWVDGVMNWDRALLKAKKIGFEKREALKARELERFKK